MKAKDVMFIGSCRYVSSEVYYSDEEKYLLSKATSVPQCDWYCRRLDAYLERFDNPMPIPLRSILLQEMEAME